MYSRKAHATLVNAACGFCGVCVNFGRVACVCVQSDELLEMSRNRRPSLISNREKKYVAALLQQLKLCSTNSPPTARVRRADEGSADDIDDKVDVDDDALTEAAAGDSIDVDDNDDDNDDDKANDDNNDDKDNDDKDNDEFEVLVDVKKLNTKMSAANKRALFAKVMSEQHKMLDSDVLAGAWAICSSRHSRRNFKTRV